MAGIGQLPPHHQHQEESEKQEEQRGHRILHADHFMVGRENLPRPEARIVMGAVAARILV